MKIRITGRAYINGKKKARKISGVVSVPNQRIGFVAAITPIEPMLIDGASWDAAVDLWHDCMFDELADGPAETVDEIFVETIKVLEDK